MITSTDNFYDIVFPTIVKCKLFDLSCTKLNCKFIFFIVEVVKTKYLPPLQIMVSFNDYGI